MTRLILLVDDNLDVMKVEHRLLRQIRPDDSIVCAFDGQSAWGLLNRLGPVDLVVSDWDMPRMDGCELARRVRDRFPLLPFVLVSGNPDLRGAAGCGASALLEKPFTREQLRSTLATLLGEDAPAMEAT